MKKKRRKIKQDLGLQIAIKYHSFSTCLERIWVRMVNRKTRASLLTLHRYYGSFINPYTRELKVWADFAQKVEG